MMSSNGYSRLFQAVEFGGSDDLLRINVITPALLFGLSLNLEEANELHLRILLEHQKSLE